MLLFGLWIFKLYWFPFLVIEWLGSEYFELWLMNMNQIKFKLFYQVELQ